MRTARLPRINDEAVEQNFRELQRQIDALSAGVGPHTHDIADVTGLQTALDGKASTSHTHALDDISDVVISGLSSGHVLKYNGTNWVNDTVASGASTLDDLTDVVITTPGSAHFLAHNGSNWVNRALIEADYPQHNLLSRHTVSGLTIGHFLRATGTGSFDFEPLVAADIPSHTHDLTTDVEVGSGALITSHGGTGVVAPTSGNLLVGQGTSAMQLLAPGADGGFVRSNGASWVRATIGTGDLPSHDIITKHSASGLTSGHVLRATGATSFAFGALQASDLPSHDLTSAHSESGLTAGHVLRATGATTFAWGAIASSDLPSHNHSATDITSGVFTVSQGGTGLSTLTGGGRLLYASSSSAISTLALTSGNLILGGGTGAPTLLAPGAAGGYVRSNGSAWARNSGVPASEVTAGTFPSGDYNFPAAVGVAGVLTVSPASANMLVLTNPSDASLSSHAEFRTAEGTANRNIYLLFHQPNRWYYRIKASASGFALVQGASDTVTDLTCGAIVAGGNVAVTGTLSATSTISENGYTVAKITMNTTSPSGSAPAGTLWVQYS